MEIGNQIKQLRQRRGITQEEMAQHFSITAQAISKWERCVATPDIAMLPAISAYFGVTIDELFALSDDTRMERIQNMLWDVRFIPQSDVDSAREFLLEKARREPTKGRALELLADLENHLAKEHQAKASDYAKEALMREPGLRFAHGELIAGMDGYVVDWNATNHCKLIDWYKAFLAKHPDCKNAYLSIMDQLIDDYRITEASEYCDRYVLIDNSYRVALYRGKIAWQDGRRQEAFEIWKHMEHDFPKEWCVYHNIADYLLRSGEIERVAAYYRKAIEIQTAPRYTDPYEALAQFYEMTGDYACAISVLYEQLDVFEKEWNFTTGETADIVRREIARLEAKIQ